MSEPETFREAISRIRAGDEQAATELVLKYERLIRREVRLQLEDQRLRRVFDSMDVTQSVMASFFLRTAAGQYDLDNPNQLIRLLVRMTRNKVASAVRKQYQHRRDSRRTEDALDPLESVASNDPSPSEQVANREMLEALQQELTLEERELTELRAEGLSWNDIAGQLGGKAQARRMQLTRGIERAARVLGLAQLYD